MHLCVHNYIHVHIQIFKVTLVSSVASISIRNGFNTQEIQWHKELTKHLTSYTNLSTIGSRMGYGAVFLVQSDFQQIYILTSTFSPAAYRRNQVKARHRKNLRYFILCFLHVLSSFPYQLNNLCPFGKRRHN